jgi:SAM-dependent methyltransferase
MSQTPTPSPVPDVTASAAQAIEGLDTEALRAAIREEYSAVAEDPQRGFHFHTGRPLARLLSYDEEWLRGVPEPTIASFAGTGNPFSLGVPRRGERVVDVGCGAGIDTIIAARMVGPEGRVIGVDMTPAMLERARASAKVAGLANVHFELGVAEQLPVEDGWADVVISNGVVNLFPDKLAGLREMARALRPEGRLQVGDILVSKPVSLAGKRNIDLWKA